ncbi:MAG: hypothetical protein ABI867_42505 [Kofleriaceae bacterium]
MDPTQASHVLARIKIPAEAVIPLLIGFAALLVLLFAGAALKTWKDKHPKPARITGVVFAVGLAGFTLFKVVTLVPQTDENDRVYQGVYNVTLFDGPILGFCALMAVIFWGYAGLRKVALGFGLVVAAAMVAKPFIWPLFHHYSGSGGSGGRARSVMDLEHLGFIGPGIAVLVAALVVGLGRDRVAARQYPPPPYPPPPPPPPPVYPPN